MKLAFILLLFTYVILCCLCSIIKTFDDVSGQVFDDAFHDNGVIAAFGDFTADKKVDLFIITDLGRTLKIIISHDVPPFYRAAGFTCSYTFTDSSVITSVVPGDFNGDNFMDVMLTIKEKSSSTVKIKMVWGYKTKIDCRKNDQDFTMKGQPLALDYDGDGIVELLGEDENGIRSIWKFSNYTAKRSKFPGSNSLPPMVYPHSNAFVDLNGDLQADIFINNKKKLEFWINEAGKYSLNKEISLPPGVKYYQISFCDLDANGSLEAIVPVCISTSCDDSAIYAYANDKWENIGSKFIDSGKNWKFVVPDSDNELLKSMQQPTLRIADLNMDGYPDIMTIMHSSDDQKDTRIFVMMNVPSDTNSVGRKYNISYSIDIENASVAAFHDVFDNGRMDLLVNTMSSLTDVKLHAFRNTMYYDAYFLKVIVMSGQCSKSCPHSVTSYGGNIPGASVRISTITSQILKRYGYYALFPKSAYFSLELPYMIFGLGQTPNFVETFRIGLPRSSNTTKLERNWEQIIPNSQVVIVPYPLNSPSNWYMKLFVTTSRLVLITSGALVGTCFFIVLIIIFLHWREKREDRKEKQQEAHRFHFNAM